MFDRNGLFWHLWLWLGNSFLWVRVPCHSLSESHLYLPSAFHLLIIPHTFRWPHTFVFHRYEIWWVMTLKRGQLLVAKTLIKLCRFVFTVKVDNRTWFCLIHWFYWAAMVKIGNDRANKSTIKGCYLDIPSVFVSSANPQIQHKKYQQMAESPWIGQNLISNLE